MRRRREDADLFATAIHDRQQPAGIGGGVLDVLNARMRCEPRDAIEREIRTLELRIGIDHDGNIDRIRNGAKIGFDLRIGQRKIRLQDRQNAVGAEFLIRLRLRHRIQRRGRGNAGHDRHAAFRGLNRGLNDGFALGVVKIGKLAGRAEWRQAVDARSNEIVAETCQHIATNGTVGIDR